MRPTGSSSRGVVVGRPLGAFSCRRLSSVARSADHVAAEGDAQMPARDAIRRLGCSRDSRRRAGQRQQVRVRRRAGFMV